MLLTGCAAVGEKIVVRTGNDLTRTSEIAAKYNKPAVKKCSDWMLGKVKSLQEANSSLESLRAEPTEGLMSEALKLALIAEQLKSLQDANSPAMKAEFKAACSEVAGDILFNVVQDAARIGSKMK